jgi:hypothetical protein
MRSFVIALAVCSLAIAVTADAATGKVIKVLPEFLDLKGRNSLTPSLYERDAYQAQLRQHPELRSGLRFYIQWKIKGQPFEELKLRLEMRGVAQGNLPKQLTMETPIKPGGWFGHWSELTIQEKTYKNLGEVTAWRVTLWDGAEMLDEQKSFLW